jgi:hypothetical protein
MKKRKITVLLLIWLFSQHIFAAVWMLPSTNISCASSHKANCADVTSDHMSHNLPIMQSLVDPNIVDKSSSDLHNSHSNLSFSCDHCLASCQSVVPTNNSMSFLSTPTHLFDDKVIFAIVDTFSGSLYRPPITA